MLVIESARGHRFVSTDRPEHDACLTCGGMWALVDRGDGVGRYQANNGDVADYCTGEPCERANHPCNCLFCA